ncbi:MAG TPA: DUF3098 domain-containing protein [Bacteroidetes bacterium]|nr:DUF3098 domain-containing protein [Bacteroidota bacterium]
MSKSKKKVVVSTATKKKAAATVSKRKTVAAATAAKKGHPLIFNKTNYLLMLGGIGLIALGLVLMSGGQMPSPDVWDPDLIYSKRRTVLGPFVIICGLVLEIYAIFKKPTTTNNIEIGN